MLILHVPSEKKLSTGKETLSLNQLTENAGREIAENNVDVPSNRA